MARLLLISLIVSLAACSGGEDPAALKAFLAERWEVAAFESADLDSLLGDTYKVLREANLNMTYDLSVADSVQSYYGTSPVSSGTWRVGADGKTVTLELESEPAPLVLTVIERGADRVVFSWRREVAAAGDPSAEATGTMTWQVYELD